MNEDDDCTLTVAIHGLIVFGVALRRCQRRAAFCSDSLRDLGPCIDTDGMVNSGGSGLIEIDALVTSTVVQE